jgi:hypothetical protein
MSHQDDLEPIVIAACHLVASSPSVSAIHVVAEHRPTYREMLHFRALAGDLGLSMTLSGPNGLMLDVSRARRSGAAAPGIF